MFTGLIEQVGTVTNRTEHDQIVRLHIELPQANEPFACGESIAVDGACLTVSAVEVSSIALQLTQETIARTIAASYATGSRVHLERAMKLSDRLGGHLVSGHIDTVGVVESRTESGEAVALTFTYADTYDRWVVEKGSIAINGVSLTVNTCAQGRCAVMIIPYTGQHTNLAALTVGTPCNIEFDLIAKYIDRQQQIDKRAGNNTEVRYA